MVRPPPPPAVPTLRRKRAGSEHVDVMATMAISSALSPPGSPESSQSGENDPGVANSTRARDTSAVRNRASSNSLGRTERNDDDEKSGTLVPERYDPNTAGVFPPRAKRDWTESATMSAMPESGTGLGTRAEGEPPLPGSAFGWVPPAGSTEEFYYVRPTAAELPSQPSGAGDAASSSAAPLELFDDPELETRAPTEWLALGDVGGAGARSRYFTKHGQFAWKPCLVTSYDEASRTYEIEWRETPGIKKRVRRLNLVFDAEDSDAFRTRLAAATTLRKHHEQIKRYRALAEGVVFENDVDGVLTEDRLARVFRKVGSRPAPERMPECTATFLEDAKDDFRRATKRSILDLSLDDPEKARAIAREVGAVPPRRRPKVPRVAIADRFDGRSSAEASIRGSDAAARAIGALETHLPDADPGFLEALQKFYASYDAQDERLMLLAASAVEDVKDGVPMALFPGAPLPPPRPMSLEAFERFHRQYMQETASRVRANLTSRACALCVALEEHVRDVALSAEDPAVRAAHLARLQKMPRFAQRLTLAVQDGLRTAVERGARDAREFWTRGFAGGDAAAEGEGAHARHRPMFSVRLVVSDGAAAFEPPLEAVRDVALAIFDDAIDMFKGFQCVREKVMQQRGALDPSAGVGDDARAETDEFGIQKRVVPTPARDEPFVVEARAAIAQVLEENFPGPRALAERFAAFEELMEKAENRSAPPEEAPKEVDRQASGVEDSAASADAAAEASSSASTAAGSGPAGPAGSVETPAGTSEPLPSEPSETKPLEPDSVPEPASAPPAEEEEEEKEMTLAETEAEMRRLAELVDAVESTSDSFEPFRLVGVDCVEIKRALVDVAIARRDALVAKLVEEFHVANGEAYGRFRAITDRLASEVDTPEALDDLRRFAVDAAAETETLHATLATSAATAEALERSGITLQDDVVDTYWNAITQPASVPGKLRAFELRAKELQKAMTETLKADIKANTASIAEAKAAVHEFMELGDIDLAEDRLAAVEAMDARLAELKRAGETYANREELFGRPVTTYPALNSLFREWEPYANLWRVCAEFGRHQPEWTNGPFPQLDPEKVTGMVETWNRAIVKMLKHIKGVPADVCAELKRRLAAFETNLPIVASLRNPGLRDRHWKDMSEDLGFAVKADAEFSLARAVQLGLHRHVDVLEKYSEAASKEYSLERALDAMHQNWRGVAFETSPWRDTGSFVLKGTDDTQMLLDDQIVKTQSMRSSPYIGPFEDRVKLWEKKLTTIQEVLDQWLKMQSGWLYLEPIFGSDDIMQQMPAEGRKFKTVDTTWRKTMLKLELTSEVLVVGADEDLLGSLRKCNELLDEVNKGLSEYLETKRLAFPRFYFLSNDELLEILSETKDPLRVQPFLKKVFEAIHLLEFQKNMEVTAMLSEEGEKVPFVTTFNPAKAGGAVEKWLIQCEAAQRETVAAMCRDASAAYATSKRTDWMVEWPGQVVLCIGSLYWTSQTEAAIREGTMKAHAGTVSSQLMDIVEKVRGKLTKLQRKTLSALVVLEVHARDVVAELAEKGVPSVEDFDWASQLRYTWDTMDDGKEGVTVRMINAAIYYGNEYLGNSSRLVITPLTDRCYRTLMGAVHLDVGGAPEGPAGTGKTETTKDLAKAIAMQCVVFNCSDGLDYLAMAKFFKGLAASGAWACFDEFNRIDLEVLSVIAQQILTITRAKAARALVFDFEGTRLPLRRTCNVFITMNPGYAGRSELPDNLKALFRTVAMMVPDYAMISEVFLFSNGYLEARSLAVKLVATYKLCSEQLSSQSHYDYGMRAVISVLRAAGAVKLKYPDRDESVLMLISLKDVNLPKFLAPDVPLFNNILSDLFPGVELPEPDYDHMRASLELECARNNLQPTPVFLEKIFQLYEMILVRHGLMIVGYSYGAKTCMYRTLAGALGDLNSKGLLEENKVKVVVINPKSIYMGQLYGQFDPTSHEWQDGVLAKKYRELAVDTSPDRKWVMFDGPVDAIWIENMNTVLDDNKKLCLMSGEIIAMSNGMNMIFEVQDLAVASPATVSRCGMIYVEPTEMGWEPLKQSWMATLPETLKPHFPRLEELFAWLVEPCLRFVRKNCKELVPTSDINLPVALMNIFESMIDEFRVGQEEEFAMSDKDQRVFVDCSFAFATVWSIGGTTDSAGRKKFDDFFRKLVDKRVDEKPERVDYDLGPGVAIAYPENKLSKTLPAASEGSVYDLHFDKEMGRWKNWLKVSTVDTSPLNERTAFLDIIVTTIDTVRYRFLFDLLVDRGKHVLFAGPTGTGKTVYIQAALDARDKSTFRNIQSTFSAQTNANAVQDIIDSKLDKRRKGVFGPPIGSRAVVFVDDLNMPELEEYGAQPPIELVRQFFDHGGWYDRGELVMRQLQDVQFAAAMGPPGGGRNPITPRMLRHFNLVSVCDFDDASLTRVYGQIADWWCRRAGLPSDVAGKTSNLVKATLEIYNTIKLQLLPTPSKSHYTYNMRDLSKVWQGVSMVGNVKKDLGAVVRLWAHESLRVFHDRLVDDADRLWFFDFVKKMVSKHCGLQFDKVFEHLDFDNNGSVDISELRNLMYADFYDGEGNYAEVTDLSQLLAVVEEQLVEYNQQSKTRMDLVLFLYAAEHICRISRVIRQELGNALLVGVGGSGRQSLTRIAAFMAEYQVFQIEISKSYGAYEWREDLKVVLRKAGAEGKPTVFLFSDTQIKLESFLEDINNVLNTGEVPNLFAKDEIAQIAEAVTVRAKKAGINEGAPAQEKFKFFVQECRKYLHCVLCMSPVGDAFRERLRKFPSLVNCCTIDWFSEWPTDALQSVATQFLSEVKMDDDAARAACIEMCMVFHTSVRRLSEKFLANLGRHCYVTPTSYLELISTYKTLLAEKRTQVSTLRDRYESGLAQIFSAEEQVETMKVELIELGPVLAKTQVETDEILVVVGKETEQANEVRAVVAKDEAFAAERAEEAKAIKEDCEAELAVAIPMLNDALAALDTLTKADITEVKAMKKPPAGVKLVMEAVCILKGVKPEKVKDPAGGLRKVEDYWIPAQKLLGDSGFLASLRDFDKDNMPNSVVKKITKMVAMPEFQPEVIKKASIAAYGLCCWARAMESYDRVAKIVAPKREKLAAAEAEYAELMAGLEEKRAKLQEVEDNLQALNDKLNEMQDKKAKLEHDVDQCEKKLVRAEKLIGGLGGEKSRWKEVAGGLTVDYRNLTGDVLLCAAYIAYLGPFTLPFREEVLTEWVATLREKNVPCSDTFKLIAVLGEPVKIREWTIDGLPNDSFSIDNAIVMSKSRRWPLIIDPQAQANKWIRSMEKANNLVVVKLTDGDFVRKLENAIQFGTPVLLENVGEELDPTLEPLLLKSTFKQGGSLCIRLGDATIEYHDQFRFYVTTKLRNPHYLPETSVKVTLLNMMITIDGLTDQLLGIAVAKERPDLEEEKVRLVLQGAENARQLKEVEDKIIEVLGSSEGSILESETAIEIISSAKTLSNEIAEKQAVAAVTEQQIDETRLGYRPVAVHVAHLFFNVGELCNIEPMYQYSLAWYVRLFDHAILNAAASEDLEARLANLIDFFTYSLYKNICRSLFEKDKLLFSFTLAATIFGYKGSLDPAEYRFLLTGGLGQKDGADTPPAPWLSEKLWLEMLRLSDLPAFAGRSEKGGDDATGAEASEAPTEGASADSPSKDANDKKVVEPFCACFARDPSAWRHVYDSASPETEPLPEPWHSALSPFQKLCVLRTIRPDKLTRAVQIYVEESMGRRYIEPPPFDLDQCFADSTCVTPLVFVLSPGSDPMSGLLKYAESRQVKMESLSLGQGQGAKAEALIAKAAADGSWVVLQNCHLAVSWMTTLERICEAFVTDPEPPHENFRVWLTSYPSPHFPVAVLQNGVKMTNEPPKGMRANMMQSFANDPISDPDFYEDCARPLEFKKLLVGLAFFHAAIQERIKFGPLGWNIPYGFNDPDLKISLRQLRMFLDESSPDAPLATPLKTLVYLVGECNYGGRVTDGHDRRTLMSILTDENGGPFHANIMLDDYVFSPSGVFRAPALESREEVLEYFKQLPIAADPEVFGLHANADIAKDQKETDLLLDGVLLTQGSSSSGGGTSKEDTLKEVAAQISDALPPLFDLEVANYKYPVEYYESMNSVLCQELVRYNRLLAVIHKSIDDFGLALRGRIVMTGELDALGSAMYDGKIPAMWAKKSYPSLKPLAAYVSELLKRLAMLQSWIDDGAPPRFWITGFFFTHAFLTGVLQNYARKRKLPIDSVVFDFKAMPSTADFATKPEDGAFCDGIFMEGCKWDEESMLLQESDPKVLYTDAPTFWFVPTAAEERAEFPHYLCPIYRTAERRGVLATTGHSSNFVINLTIPSDRPQNHWIKRGVAGLLSLSY